MLILKIINLSAPWLQYRNRPLSSILERGEWAIHPHLQEEQSFILYCFLVSLPFSLTIHPLFPSCTSFPPWTNPLLTWLFSLPAASCSNSGVVFPHMHISAATLGKCLSTNLALMRLHSLEKKGEKYPRNYQIGNENLINQRIMTMFWYGCWHPSC